MRSRSGINRFPIVMTIILFSAIFLAGMQWTSQVPGPLSPLPAEAAPDGVCFIDQNHPGASDVNPGSEDSPWLTIQHAADTLEAGDTVFVAPGTYEEQVQMNVSGDPGNPITFNAEEGVIVRSFTIHDQSYLRIIGFEITHLGTGIQLSGIHMIRAHGVEILDNYIHHTYALGIWMHHAGASNDVVIRGNRMEFIGAVEGHEAGETAILVRGDNNLVEYNDISHVGDFTNVWGEKNILRNNYFHDNYLADFPQCPIPEGHHIDGLQSWSNAEITLTRTLMENNLIIDSTVPNAHTVLIRDIENTGSSEFLFRNNVGVRNGSYPFGVEQVENARFVHNTLIDALSSQSPKAWYCVSFLDYSNDGSVINNIFYDSVRDGGRGYHVDPESQAGFYGDYNLAYNPDCGSSCSWNDPILSETHSILNQDPRFTNFSGDDFHLQVDSPGVDSAGALTRTVNAGSGTLIAVQDSGYFVDGWGRGLGDLINIGANEPVRITSIEYGTNRITVDRSISWNSGDAVNYAFQGSNPDRGAYEAGTSKNLAFKLPARPMEEPSAEVYKSS